MREPRGYTLAEMLVAMVLAGIVGGSVLGVLLRQNSFYRQANDLVYAEQSLRAGLDLMASELRMASPRDLLAAEPDSVSVRFDVWRGVVCTSDASTDEAAVFVHDSVGNANVPASFRGYGFSNPYDSLYDYGDDWSASVDLSSGQTECENAGSPAGQESWRYRTLSGWGSSPQDTVPDRGAVLRHYGRLTFRFDPSNFTSGTAVWRNSQELVAPFEEEAAFSYLMADGSVQSSVSPADFPDVRAVRVTVVALGEHSATTDVSRSISFDIRLRQ